MTTEQQDTSANLQQYCVTGDPEISDNARAVFTQYSGIPEEDIVAHVREVRDKAWKIFKFPCIGSYSFVRFNIANSPKYGEALERVKNGQKLLDLACCFGQDLRQLVVDGAPMGNLTGTELERGFLDLGYELFKDRDRFTAPLIAGDFFEPHIPGLEEQSFDTIHAASFFHLFSWDEQVQAWSHALRLLKPKIGSMVFGIQTAVAQAGTIRHPATRSGEMYRHNADSFRKLVAQVAEKEGVKLDCEVTILEVPPEKRGRAAGGHWSILQYCARLI